MRKIQFCADRKRDKISNKREIRYYTFTTAQIRCKYKRAKLVSAMKANMPKSDANMKFSIIFADFTLHMHIEQTWCKRGHHHPCFTTKCDANIMFVFEQMCVNLIKYGIYYSCTLQFAICVNPFFRPVSHLACSFLLENSPRHWCWHELILRKRFIPASSSSALFPNYCQSFYCKMRIFIIIQNNNSFRRSCRSLRTNSVSYISKKCQTFNLNNIHRLKIIA